VAHRSVSASIIVSDLEGRDAMGQIFQSDLLNNARTV